MSEQDELLKDTLKQLLVGYEQQAKDKSLEEVCELIERLAIEYSAKVKQHYEPQIRGLKEDVKSFEHAVEVLGEQKRLDRPELREKIKHFATEFWEDLNQDMEDLKKAGWTNEEWFEILIISKAKLADQILALFNTEQIDAMLVEARRTAKKQERERIKEWGSEVCEEHSKPTLRRCCHECWQALKEGKK